MNELTFENEVGLHCYSRLWKTSVDLLSSASSAARPTMDRSSVSTNTNRRRSASWFAVEAVVKGYKAYKDSWDAVLGEEMPCQKDVGNHGQFF